MLALRFGPVSLQFGAEEESPYWDDICAIRRPSRL